MKTSPVGRRVEFRNKYGQTVTGTVVKVSARYGSMDLIMDSDGSKGAIRYPFTNPATRFLEGVEA